MVSALGLDAEKKLTVMMALKQLTYTTSQDHRGHSTVIPGRQFSTLLPFWLLSQWTSGNLALRLHSPCFLMLKIRF